MSNAFKILILDDDKSFSNSLSESLKAYNYETVTCETSFDAEDKIKSFCPNLLIVDLFIPGGNGSDWVNSLLKQAGFDIPIIYVSGVFTDLEFQNSLIHHPLILKVFSKPFEVSEFLQVISRFLDKNKNLKKQSLSFYNLDCVEQMLISSNYLPEHFLKFLEKPINFSSKNLPQYLNYFFNNKSTGFVNIKIEEITAEIHYTQGNISFIKMNDLNSSFGYLLTKLSSFQHKDVENYCMQAKASKHSIGSFLLKKKLIKEEEIFKVMNLQIAIRLLKLFDAGLISCQWKEKEFKEQALFGHFSQRAWQRILARFSKNLKINFLETFVKKFENYYLSLKQDSLPNTINKNNFLDSFSKIQSSTLKDYVQLKGLKDIKKLKGLQDLYLFLLLDLVALSGSKKLSKKELISINENNKNKNYFELLDITTESTEANIKKAYRRLSKKFHPDNCSFINSSDEKKLYEEIFNSISQAYATLSKNQMRESYHNLLEQEKFENQFNRQLLESKIIAQLQKQSLSNLMVKINNPRIVYGKKQVFLLWALTVAYREEQSQTKRVAIKEKMKIYLKNIPESIVKFDHFIYFAKALYYEVTGHLEEAKYFFSKIKNTESMDITQSLADIDMILDQKHNVSRKKRDVKFGIVVFSLIAVILGFKFSQTSLPDLPITINTPVAKTIKKIKAKRTLSSIEKKQQASNYFSALNNFRVNLFKDSNAYKLVVLQQHVSDKLRIIVYKQLSSKANKLTENNFIQKQNSVKVIKKILQHNSILEKQYAGLWYGQLTDKNKTKVTVYYIKKQKSFIYFIGNFKNTFKLSDQIKVALKKL